MCKINVSIFIYLASHRGHSIRQCAIYMYELAGHCHILVLLMESDLCKTSVMQMRNAWRLEIQHTREDTVYREPEPESLTHTRWFIAAHTLFPQCSFGVEYCLCKSQIGSRNKGMTQSSCDWSSTGKDTPTWVSFLFFSVSQTGSSV